MPTDVVYLDEDRNLVPADQAVWAVHKDTDDEGRLVEERWVRVVRPGSEEAERVELTRSRGRDEPEDRGMLRVGLIVLAGAVVLLLLWILLR